MAYEYRCVPQISDRQVGVALTEWAAAGWELQTATAVINPAQGDILHYLYFRRQTSQ
jgi:hypothetical protein